MHSMVPSELERLAERIRKGEVVFFVGAGFSLDSEGMSAWEIVWRLRVRLEALCGKAKDGSRILGKFYNTFGRAGCSLAELVIPSSSSPAPRQTAEALVKGLAAHMTAVANRYYEFNDWLCDAFGELMLALAKSDPGLEKVLPVLFEEEARWVDAARRADAGSAPRRPPSRIPKCVVNEALRLRRRSEILARDRHALGKLVLMATFGFFDPEVLAGCCHGLDAGAGRPGAKVSAHDATMLYGDRLRLRHHVLARLAREGFCPTLITTNFDLLLEGALRLSGLEAPVREKAGAKGADATVGSALAVLIPHYDVISDPRGFYRRGKAHRTATLFKIHGCAGRVRGMKGQIGSHAVGDPERVQSYLRQVVYTYREIQNWRADHWTADLLRTVLRTRTLVFAGYSTADPVIHDTFRSVYEEMERNEGVSSPSGGEDATDPGAPAYFLGYSKGEPASEFHAEQVLHSASRAVGRASGGSTLEGHPQYLRFGPGTPQHPQLALDELMGLLAHRVFRAQQREALRSELAALVARLTGHRRPRSEVDSVIRAFDAHVDLEHKGILSEDAEAARRSIRRALGWSVGFHAALRREWALGLALGQRQAGAVAAGQLVEQMRHPLWYFPASERPAWTAWSAVVELAVNFMAQQLIQGRKGLGGQAEATHNTLPTVVLPFIDAGLGGPVVTRIALTLQVGGLDRMDKAPFGAGFPARRVVWTFPDDALPWRGGLSDEAPGARCGVSQVVWMQQPPASTLWNWAKGQSGASGLEGVLQWLGVSGETVPAPDKGIS